VGGSSQRAIRLWLQYDGSDFHGLQRQADGIRTVAGTLESAWLRWHEEAVSVRASSRTDAGVHARRMPVLVRTSVTVPVRGLYLGLNARLPADLRVMGADEMPAEFDVRSDAVGKRYLYQVQTGETALPLLRRHAWHVRGPLDLAAMQQAATHLVGIHDFSAFRAVGCTAASTIRHMREIAVEPCAGGVLLRVEGNAFLLNMVRIFAGTLVAVGQGRLQAEALPDILASGDRRRAGQTAPAHGLMLDDVFYGPPGAKQGTDYKALLLHMNQAFEAK
jgi:tRNA pseudouridine38-40 synthase